MKKLLLATRNAQKVVEIAPIFQALFPHMTLQGLQDLPGQENIPEVIEDRDTFEGNALKKALEIAQITGLSTLAEDSGLIIDSLGGLPGVISARWASDHDDHLNNMHLVQQLQQSSHSHHPARYKATMALALTLQDALTLGIPFTDGLPNQPNKAGLYGGFVLIYTEGFLQGEMRDTPKGNHGFSYDPYFYIPSLNQTAAEISPQTKNQISHRNAALNQMAMILAQ